MAVHCACFELVDNQYGYCGLTSGETYAGKFKLASHAGAGVEQ